MYEKYLNDQYFLIKVLKLFACKTIASVCFCLVFLSKSASPHPPNHFSSLLTSAAKCLRLQMEFGRVLAVHVSQSGQPLDLSSKSSTWLNPVDLKSHLSTAAKIQRFYPIIWHPAVVNHFKTDVPIPVWASLEKKCQRRKMWHF